MVNTKIKKSIICTVSNNIVSIYTCLVKFNIIRQSFEKVQKAIQN